MGQVMLTSYPRQLARRTRQLQHPMHDSASPHSESATAVLTSACQQDEKGGGLLWRFRRSMSERNRLRVSTQVGACAGTNLFFTLRTCPC